MEYFVFYGIPLPSVVGGRMLKNSVVVHVEYSIGYFLCIHNYCGIMSIESRSY